MLEMQTRFIMAWYAAGDAVRRKAAASRDERGEVTATTALIFLLVVAAIAAGAVIASRIRSNAERVPTP